MNKESHDYMSRKVKEFETLKDNKYYLEWARDHIETSNLSIGSIDMKSRCRKDVTDHLSEQIKSLLAMEIQEIERKMEEL
jgi:guanylate kinase